MHTETTLYILMANYVGLDGVDLGVQLLLYTDKPNSSAIEEILRQVDSHLKTAPADFDVQATITIMPDITTATTTSTIRTAPTTRATKAVTKSTTSKTAGAKPTPTLTPTPSTTNTTAGQPRRYAQQEIDSFNSGEQPFPDLEPNPGFNNTLSGVICRKCAPVVTKWWSSLKSTRLVSVSEFKEQLKQLCTKCSSNRNSPQILQSMSQFKGIQGGRNNVLLFRISKKN